MTFKQPVFYIDGTDPQMEGKQIIYVSYASLEDPEKERLITCLREHPATKDTEEDFSKGFAALNQEDEQIATAWRRNSKTSFEVPGEWFSENRMVLTIPE